MVIKYIRFVIIIFSEKIYEDLRECTTMFRYSNIYFFIPMNEEDYISQQHKSFAEMVLASRCRQTSLEFFSSRAQR